MKLQELEKSIIKDGEWACQYTLTGVVEFIENRIKEDGLQLNPDFQRGHVWTEEQQVAYIENLIVGNARNATTIYLNSPSWFSFNQKSEYNDFVCVDGLQRYTAIKLFVTNQLKAYGYYFHEFEDWKYFDRIFREITININALQTKEDVLKWYIQMNSGGTPHSKEEIERVKTMLKELEKKGE